MREIDSKNDVTLCISPKVETKQGSGQITPEANAAYQSDQLEQTLI
jgi:hypothetical protein